MLSLLLDNTSEPNSVTPSNIILFVVLAVLLVAVIVMTIMSSRKRKKQEQDAQNLINAVKPGNKVKTIGGICGIVVEVDDEENTFVLETGTETTGKSYMKFDKQAIYQTDAVVDKQETLSEGGEKTSAENVPAEEPSVETTEKETE